MTNFQVFWRTCTSTTNFSHFYLDLSEFIAYSAGQVFIQILITTKCWSKILIHLPIGVVLAKFPIINMIHQKHILHYSVQRNDQDWSTFVLDGTIHILASAVTLWNLPSWSHPTVQPSLPGHWTDRYSRSLKLAPTAKTQRKVWKLIWQKTRQGEVGLTDNVRR